jgi:hypothetical protein
MDMLNNQPVPNGILAGEVHINLEGLLMKIRHTATSKSISTARLQTPLFIKSCSMIT